MDLKAFAGFSSLYVKKRVLETSQRLGVGPSHFIVPEFPRSGGTWISNMIRDLLSQGAKANNGLPVEVLHTHMRHDPRLRPAAYVLRDGRDVAVSLYFHHVRHLRAGTPMVSRRVGRYFVDLLGPDYDPDDVSGNLPAFIRSLSSNPFGGILSQRRRDDFLPWPEHVRDWIPEENVILVKYEDCLRDAAGQLRGIAEYLGIDAGDALLEEIVETHSFEKITGRMPGQQETDSFHRKGVAGDWKEHFTLEAASAFAQFAGDVLVSTGYETDNAWVDEL